jgi:hypothetical protein
VGWRRRRSRGTFSGEKPSPLSLLSSLSLSNSLSSLSALTPEFGWRRRETLRSPERGGARDEKWEKGKKGERRESWYLAKKKMGKSDVATDRGDGTFFILVSLLSL